MECGVTFPNLPYSHITDSQALPGTYTCAHVCKCMHVNRYVSVYVCVHACLCIDPRVCLCESHVCLCVHACVCSPPPPEGVPILLLEAGWGLSERGGGRSPSHKEEVPAGPPAEPEPPVGGASGIRASAGLTGDLHLREALGVGGLARLLSCCFCFRKYTFQTQEWSPFSLLPNPCGMACRGRGRRLVAWRPWTQIPLWDCPVVT